jgi:hypothetical protein
MVLIIKACIEADSFKNIYKNRIIEDFSNYYSECNLTDLLGKIVDKKGMKNDSKDWEYYFPCEYNSAEKRISKLESEVKENKDVKKISIIDGCDWPASKIHLWKLLVEYYGNEKANKLMPQTFLLDDNKEISIMKQHYLQNLKKKSNHMYILKNYAQRQEGLKIVNKLEDILDGYSKGFYLVQDYLYNPFLINKRKVNFRYYTLLVCRNDNVEGYIHKDGFVYYTPEFYDDDDPSFDKHITTGYIDRKIYDENPLTLDDFREHLETIEPKSSKTWDANVNELMNKIIKAISKKVCQKDGLKKHTLFQLFGSDVAPTADLDAYLMEINKGPDLDAKDERDKKVKTRVQEDIFKVVDGEKDTRFVRVL